MKSFRSIRRYFRDAIHGVFRNFSLSLASISCITITLIVVAVSLILSYNVEHFSDSIRKDVTVVMFLKKETTKEDLTKIKKELESIENIENSSIELKTKEESANELKNGNEIFATTVDRWTEETNPLLDSYMFKVKDIVQIDDTVKEVKNLSFSKDKINNINYGEDIVHQLIEVFNVVKKICIVAVLSAKYFSSHKNVQSELLLYNIEALAAGEHAQQGRCYGTGTLDCPVSHDKVEYIFGGYSLEDLY